MSHYTIEDVGAPSDGRTLTDAEKQELVDHWNTNQDADEREAERRSVRDQMLVAWDALPGFIRGPFMAQFRAANDLLDQSQDEEARAIIEFADAPSGYSDEQTTAFEQARTDLLIMMDAL